MASSNCSLDAEEIACHDTFPEVAFFEVPSDQSNNSKSVSSKTRELVKHPAFKQISAVNGEINRFSLKTLKVELEKLNIDIRGTKDVLRKRLKSYERRRILGSFNIEDPNTPKQYYTHLLVIDFEATCEEHQTKDYIHEIIEFPAVLVSVKDVAVVAEFHRLVRPLLNPTLTPFCRELTAIPQSGVESASCFPEVLQQFEGWLVEQGVSPSDGHTKLAVATDGPWDMARFLLMQCSVSKLPFPSWARSWINLRKVFSNFYVTKRLCLSEMLGTLGLEFQGRPHCGLDDARNIATIAEVLVRDGASPRVNETIAHLPRYTPPTLKGSSVASVSLKEFETSERRRNRASQRPVAAAPNSAAVEDLCPKVTHLQIPATERSNTLNNSTSSGTTSPPTAASNTLQHCYDTLQYSTQQKNIPIQIPPIDPCYTNDSYSGISEQDNSSGVNYNSREIANDSSRILAGNFYQDGCYVTSTTRELNIVIASEGSNDKMIYENDNIDTNVHTLKNASNGRKTSPRFALNSKFSTCSSNNCSSDYSPSDNDSSTSQENVCSNDEWIKSMPYVSIVRSNDSIDSCSSRTNVTSTRDETKNRVQSRRGNKSNQKGSYSNTNTKNVAHGNANDRGSARNPHQGSEQHSKPPRRSNKQCRGRTGPARSSYSIKSNATRLATPMDSKNNVASAVDFSDTKEFPVLGSAKKCFR